MIHTAGDVRTRLAGDLLPRANSCRRVVVHHGHRAEGAGSSSRRPAFWRHAGDAPQTARYCPRLALSLVAHSSSRVRGSRDRRAMEITDVEP